MVKVLLILPSQLLRDALRRLLTADGYEVNADATTVSEGLTEAGVGRFDLVIVDGSFCETAELQARIRDCLEQAKIIILSNQGNITRIATWNIFDADGILSFDSSAHALIESLRLIQLNERVVPYELVEELARRESHDLAEQKMEDGMSVSKPDCQLPTRRETEILQCLVGGHPNKVIARRLGITEATVKVHLKGLLRKIHASNRTQAAIWAINNGLRDMAHDQDV